MSTSLTPIIGLEIHVQLKTKSKMFCQCDASYFGTDPNTHTCPTCLGLPGALPRINEKAVEETIRVGLALNCSIPEESKFDRKNYFYPDLVKGYQISQYDQPFCIDGWLEIADIPSPVNGGGKPAEALAQAERKEQKQNEKVGNSIKIGITRAHLEEDTAKSIHETDPQTGESYSLIDCNKSGVPLLEIVSEPDLHTAEQASAYARKVRQIVRYIGSSDCDMEKGQMRFDINISMGTNGDNSEYTPIVEVKNLNSFRALEKALAYEIDRQTREFEKTGQLYEMGNKETRGWDYDKEITFHQRSKEEAHDYRYFPEPDLPPLRLERDYIERLRSELPELPDAKSNRFIEQYALKPKDALVLTQERAEADWFEQAVKGHDSDTSQEVTKWLLGDVYGLLSVSGKSLLESQLQPAALVSMVKLIADGTISGKIAKEILPDLIDGQNPEQIIESKGLKQLSDTGELEQVVDEVIAENDKLADEIRRGKEGGIQFLMGQVMKKTRGQANPPIVQKILREKLL